MNSRDSYLFEVTLDLFSLHVGVFQMELFGLYWHIWSKLMILPSEKLIEIQKFGKSSIEFMGQHISANSEHVMVIQRGMH